VVGGVLRTPDIEYGILPGVTREAVLELARNLEIPVSEDDITLNELFQADEAFLTNSVMEIMPLTEVDGKKIGSGTQGVVTLKLMGGYKEMVRGEVGET
jgi:branched-subunit amino acid aminotransferase/4-amino-4-deoxychorismate lyase